MCIEGRGEIERERDRLETGADHAAGPGGKEAKGRWDKTVW